jgi:hypothetical protein
VTEAAATLPEALARTIEVSRRAEQELIGGIDPAVREQPIREGDWTSQDHQAHLTAWKGRQADRFRAAREGREIPRAITGDETDAINAELQALRAGWAWDDLVREADGTAARLASEIRATEPEVILGEERLLGGTFGNGIIHTLVHLRWLHEAGTGIDLSGLRAFASEAESLARDPGIPATARADLLYDVACFVVLDGRSDEARPLLVEAFRDNPELVPHAATDPDLTPLSSQLPELARLAEAG